MQPPIRCVGNSSWKFPTSEVDFGAETTDRPSYRHLWSGQICSNFGSSLTLSGLPEVGNFRRPFPVIGFSSAMLPFYTVRFSRDEWSALSCPITCHRSLVPKCVESQKVPGAFQPVYLSVPKLCSSGKLCSPLGGIGPSYPSACL